MSLHAPWSLQRTIELDAKYLDSCEDYQEEL
jgi:hypothetical protein